jgi:SMODS-associated and fused to various effectors sensor domain
VTRDDLLEMLSHLVFRTGLTVSAERDHVQTLMIAAGLDGSDDALQSGLDCVAGWVKGGKRIVHAAEIHEAADRLGLRRSEAAAVLVVQAIDIDPHADEATIALDWVDLFDGDDPKLRFQPHDPAAWIQIDRDLTDAAGALENDGWRSVFVRGALRQATFFRVGTVLPAVRGHTLRYVQGKQPWSTDMPKAPIAVPQALPTPIGAGADLAVAVGVAVNLTTAVLGYIRDSGLPVDHLLTILPAEGADDQAVASAGQAITYAQNIRDLVREDLELHPDTPRIHLFLAGPGGLALLLGHRWNRTHRAIHGTVERGADDRGRQGSRVVTWALYRSSCGTAQAPRLAHGKHAGQPPAVSLRGGKPCPARSAQERMAQRTPNTQVTTTLRTHPSQCTARHRGHRNSGSCTVTTYFGHNAQPDTEGIETVERVAVGFRLANRTELSQHTVHQLFVRERVLRTEYVELLLSKDAGDVTQVLEVTGESCCGRRCRS